MTDLADLPTGTVTFLFAALEGSPRVHQAHPAAYRAAVRRHHALLRAAVEAHGGVVFEAVGDAVHAAFARPTDAAGAALAGQVALHREAWGEVGALRARMGVHLGEVERREGRYVGAPLQRCARLLATAHGGQVLLSGVTAALVREALPEGAGLHDLSGHRLNDAATPEPLFQLVHRDHPAAFPPPRPLDARPTNLPLQVTSFVGRERELAEVVRLLATERLVTLTGPGGTGKTRLALQAAAEVVDGHPDGVWLVELAALADPDLVPQAVAVAVGVPEEPGRPLLSTLAAVLPPRRLLLVLDNCEHLVEACARLAAALLRTCPHVHLLATSREALGIAGELVWPVPPLSLPPPGAAAPEAVARADAARLFVRRARATQPRFALSAQNAATVARLCRRLDGLPLALELAAARVRALSVAEVLERLDDRFRLLTGGRAALPRQQTLQATLDWSYELLTHQEQTLFERLSIFVGGCTLAAAEAVCADAPETSPERQGAPAAAPPPGAPALAPDDVLDVLTRLVDKSLVEVGDDAEGRTRYRLLETVRAYGRAKLAARGALADLEARHAHHFVRVAEAADPELRGPDQARWLDRLEADHDNFRAALRWSLEPGAGRGALGVRLGAALIWYWRMRAFGREVRDTVEALLALPATADAAPARARLLDLLVAAGYRQDAGAAGGRLAAALDEDLTKARRRGDTPFIIRVLTSRALQAHRRGEEATAAALFGECRALAERAGLREEAADALRRLGSLARDRRDYAAAGRHLEASLQLYRAAGNHDRAAAVLNLLGYVRHAQGEPDGARALHQEALGIWRRLGYRIGVAGATRGLGEVDLAQGDLATARARFEESAALFREHDATTMLARALVDLALVDCATGDTAAARGHLAETVAIRRELGYEREVAETIEAFAGAAAGLGRAREALRLGGAATARRRATGQPRPPLVQAHIDQALAVAHRALAASAAAVAVAEGEVMPLDQVLDLAAAAATVPGAPAGGAAVADAARGPQLRIDPATCEVWRGGDRVPRRLSPQELALLRYLAEHGDRVCLRRELGDATWGAHNWDPNMLHRLVRRLREKLEPAPARPRYLHTVPGIGYRLTAAP